MYMYVKNTFIILVCKDMIFNDRALYTRIVNAPLYM